MDTQGDAFFFAFPEPSGALAAAQQMTEGLVTGPIEVRVGLHTGTPRLAEEGYVGSDVHFGARVAACAHGGQVVLSQATRDLVDGDVLRISASKGVHESPRTPSPLLELRYAVMQDSSSRRLRATRQSRRRETR